jgi:hypothetical protein
MLATTRFHISFGDFIIIIFAPVLLPMLLLLLLLLLLPVRSLQFQLAPPAPPCPAPPPPPPPPPRFLLTRPPSCMRSRISG